MFNLFNNEKLPHGLRKLIVPSKKFMDKDRMAFLAVFDAAHPGARPSHITAVARALIACGALIGILGGMSVYADTANVGVNNALYPLKRLGESVQLTLATQQEKPQLQAAFAGRRAAEIEALVADKATSTAIAGLSVDLNTAVDDSVTAAADAKLEDGKLDTFCNNIFSAIATSSIALHGELSIKPKAFLRFENICAEDIGANNATTTIVAVPPPTHPSAAGAISKHSFVYSSSTTANPTNTEIHIRGGGLFNIIFNHAPGGLNGDENTTNVPSENQDQNENDNGTGITASGTASTTIFFPDVQSLLKSRKNTAIIGD